VVGAGAPGAGTGAGEGREGTQVSWRRWGVREQGSGGIG
jgi:hypothetical protein